VENQAVDIVGEVGERDLRLGARDADGTDEQPHLILLAGKHMLDAGTQGRPGGVGARGACGHRFAPGLLAMNAADPADRLQPRLVGLATIGGVCPHIGRSVVVGHHVTQHPPVEAGAIGDLAAADEAITPANRDTVLIPKAWDSDVDPWLATGQRSRLRKLHRPACIDILLRRFGWLIGPDRGRALALLDRRLLGCGVTLLGCGNQRGVDDLSSHRQITALA
jgi:hypothetical protein